MTYRNGSKTLKTTSKETSAAEKAIETEETVGTKEISGAEKLEAFKKGIWKEINSLSWGSSISIQITDKAFEKMMNDTDFKNKMMNLIREDARGSHIMCGGTLINIDENGFSGYSYMADHAKEAETAFKAHSKNKDSFYIKKVTKNHDYTELWIERNRLDKKAAEEKELEEKLTEKQEQLKELTESQNANLDIRA